MPNAEPNTACPCGSPTVYPAQPGDLCARCWRRAKCVQSPADIQRDLVDLAARIDVSMARELQRGRAAISPADAEKVIAAAERDCRTARLEERDAIVAFLRANGDEVMAAAIKRGEHHA